VDLDVFDRHYEHLLLFDTKGDQLIGAYRIAFCDQVLKTRGARGLYTSTLFHLGDRFLVELGSALELGRAFVRLEYQRQPLPLATLWRGIGEVLVRNPRYDRLFGCVSISPRYRGTSRRLMINFLARLRMHPTLAALVRPKRPAKHALLPEEQVVLERGCHGVRELSRVVLALDDQARGVPVLLTRYLELGGQVLGFNLDPAFGGCVDALTVMDVLDLPHGALRRFLGEPGWRHYLRYHGRSEEASAHFNA
jgi:putative hemolysin